MTRSPDRRFSALLSGVILLLACVVLAPVREADAPGSTPEPARSLAKLHLSGEGRGGHLAIQLRGSGGPPLNIRVPTHPGDSAQAVADRLVEEMRRSAWPERTTWKPWVVGLRITHVDELLFRCTDVGLHVDVSIGTWPPSPYGLVIRGVEPESAPGNLIVYGASNLESPEDRARKLEAALSSAEPMKEYFRLFLIEANDADTPTAKACAFETGQTTSQLLDGLARRLGDGRWMVERRGAALVCRTVANGGAPTYMHVYLRRGGQSEGAELAAEWAWGLKIHKP